MLTGSAHSRAGDHPSRFTIGAKGGSAATLLKRKPDIPRGIVDRDCDLATHEVGPISDGVVKRGGTKDAQSGGENEFVPVLDDGASGWLGEGSDRESERKSIVQVIVQWRDRNRSRHQVRSGGAGAIIADERDRIGNPFHERERKREHLPLPLLGLTNGKKERDPHPNYFGSRCGRDDVLRRD